MTARNPIFAASLALALVPFAAAPAFGGAAKEAAAPKLTEAPAESQGTPMLRDAITIDGKLVYLGDLFINAGPKADTPVAYAPRPGERAVFDARWLYRVARAYGLNWRPLSVRQETVVERVSQVIERTEIEDAVLAALYERGAEPDSELELSMQLSRVHVASDVRANVGVDDVTYDPRTRRFAAVVSIPAGDPAGEKLRLTGRLHNVVKIPVPARIVNRGDIIGERDVKWIRIRADRVLPDTITTLDDLKGMAAKRGLRPDDLVRTADIERPILVERGSLVTVSLQYGPMALTAQGKALESGAMGDTVRIVNSRSKKVFEGEVSGPGRATVQVVSARELAQNK